MAEFEGELKMKDDKTEDEVQSKLELADDDLEQVSGGGYFLCFEGDTEWSVIRQATSPLKGTLRAQEMGGPDIPSQSGHCTLTNKTVEGQAGFFVQFDSGPSMWIPDTDITKTFYMFALD